MNAEWGCHVSRVSRARVRVRKISGVISPYFLSTVVRDIVPEIVFIT